MGTVSPLLLFLISRPPLTTVIARDTTGVAFSHFVTCRCCRVNIVRSISFGLTAHMVIVCRVTLRCFVFILFCLLATVAMSLSRPDKKIRLQVSYFEKEWNVILSRLSLSRNCFLKISLPNRIFKNIVVVVLWITHTEFDSWLQIPKFPNKFVDPCLDHFRSKAPWMKNSD